LASLIDDEKKLGDCQFDLWKQFYVAACAAVDDKLRRSRRLDTVQSGCTALSIIKQGDLMVVSNIGDSRVVLDTAFDDRAITPSNSSFTWNPTSHVVATDRP
jgi:serine/threonine protein phosphatase PrpC